MKLFKLIGKEIKQQFRDRQGLLLMTLFPLVLTLVLGFALSGMFETNSGPSNINCLYTVDSDAALSEAFNQHFLPISKDAHLNLKEEKDVEKAKDMVKKGDTSCLIHLTKDSIVIYTREGRDFTASLVQTIMKGFTQRTNTYMAVATINPMSVQKLSQVDNMDASFTNHVSLNRNKTPRAIDYYAVTMITLIIMYASSSAISSIVEDRRDKTLFRVFASPVSNAEILLSKVVGTVLATILQVLFVFLFGKIFLNANWGDNLLPIFLVLLAQIIMMVSVGIGSGYLFKNNSTGFSVVESIIPILIFLGGGYVNLELLGVGGFIEKLSYISPVKWINKTILQIIYANDFSTFATTLILCLTIATFFLSASAILSKKELKV